MMHNNLLPLTNLFHQWHHLLQASNPVQAPPPPSQPPPPVVQPSGGEDEEERKRRKAIEDFYRNNPIY